MSSCSTATPGTEEKERNGGVDVIGSGNFAFFGIIPFQGSLDEVGFNVTEELRNGIIHSCAKRRRDGALKDGDTLRDLVEDSSDVFCSPK